MVDETSLDGAGRSRGSFSSVLSTGAFSLGPMVAVVAEESPTATLVNMYMSNLCIHIHTRECQHTVAACTRCLKHFYRVVNNLVSVR